MAKKQYGSVLYPFEDDSKENQLHLKRTSNVEDTIKSSLRAFFKTKPGQRRGNTIGSLLGDLKHQLIKKENIPALEDGVREELNTYFRGVEFYLIRLTKTIDEELKTSDLILELQFALPGKDLQSLTVEL